MGGERGVRRVFLLTSRMAVGGEMGGGRGVQGGRLREFCLHRACRRPGGRLAHVGGRSDSRQAIPPCTRPGGGWGCRVRGQVRSQW